MTGALACSGELLRLLWSAAWVSIFWVVQKEIEMHFVGLLLAAALFSTGIVMFIITFFRHGLPSDEALTPGVSGEPDEPLVAGL